MKKFFVSLFILAVFAGVVFYFGWVQFAVPAGHAGVMVSKTGGIDPAPIVPGEFRWAWEMLLPTNCAIIPFSLRPVELSFSTTGELPSADIYSRFLEGSPDFSWSISASVSLRASQEALPRLVEKYNVESEDELNALMSALAEQAFYSAAEKYIANAAASSLLLEAESAESGAAGKPSVLPDFEALFAAEMPEGFDALSAYISEATLPDFALYRTGAKVYAEYIEQYSDAAIASAIRAAEEEIASGEQMRLFAKWGAFLEKFPSLIDFLAVARDNASGTLELLRSLQNRDGAPEGEGGQAQGQGDAAAEGEGEEP